MLILYCMLIQATLAVDFDVGFAIKEKVRLHSVLSAFHLRIILLGHPSRSSLLHW